MPATSVLAPRDAHGEAPAGRGTALVVDDGAVNRALLRSLLEKRGYRVVEAPEGETAVEIYAEAQPAIVFMDVVMPGMDGYEATRRIRSRTGDRYVPIIFLTALTSPGVLQECISAGGDEFFSKPFDPSQLDARLTVIERLKEMHDTIRSQRNSLMAHQVRDMQERSLAEELMSRVVRTPEIDPAVFRSTVRPAEMFSGDVVLSARTNQGLQRILVGDVTGHGLPASVAGLVAATTFQEAAAHGMRLASTVRVLNARLQETLPDGVFVAATVVELDVRRGVARCWNGGMPPILVRPPEGGVHTLDAWHPPLGILEDTTFVPAIREIPVEPGARILTYSDGMVEARSPDRALYGEARLHRLFREGEGSRHDALLRDVEEFVGGGALEDDLTLAELIVRADEKGADAVWARPSGTWSQTVRLHGDALRQQDPTASLGFMLSDTGLSEGLRERALTAASELVANAVDHGALGLSSSLKDGAEGMLNWFLARDEALAACTDDAWVELEVGYRGADDAAALTLRTRDSGGPWSPPRQAAGDEALHGRGLLLLNELCTSIEFGPSGEWVEARIEW